ncbi:MAG: FAD-dependent oxidoreductase [Thermoleophilia bacterium]|nr:FAD-dependent oxidoreductase [Thermoleophilia bacterium]
MRRVAVIGGGIAGLGAAWALDRSGRVDVTLLEAEQYVGGHTCTVQLDDAGRSLPVDMGFIVHNPNTYPRLLRLFDELEVETRSTEMSFSVACHGCGLEYAGRGIGRQLDRFMRPRMLRLVGEIRRFWVDARSALDDPALEPLTLQQFVDSRGYSRDFQQHYLVPLTAAIWSTSPGGALEFPIHWALRFLHNHGVLQARGHEWRTVVGGSRSYVDAILRRIGGTVRTDAPVLGIRRDDDGVDVLIAGAAQPERFDEVVLATHADTSLALLTDADELERELLGQFRFTTNDVVLHEDRALLPRRRAAISAWNYQLPDCAGTGSRPTLTYSMNRLQGLDTTRPISVTLNRGAQVDPQLVLERRTMSHPQFTHESLRAQRRLPELDGRRRTWLCGAWQRYGFHEDGLWSGQRVASGLVARLRDAHVDDRTRH